MAKIIAFLFFLGSLLSDEPPLFGLTAKTAPLKPETLKHLAYIGIQFTFCAPPPPQSDLPPAPHWEGGVLFLSEFNRKEETFRKWLELSYLRPSKIITTEN